MAAGVNDAALLEPVARRRGTTSNLGGDGRGRELERDIEMREWEDKACVVKRFHKTNDVRHMLVVG
jgi:hypothetical protein